MSLPQTGAMLCRARLVRAVREPERRHSTAASSLLPARALDAAAGPSTRWWSRRGAQGTCHRGGLGLPASATLKDGDRPTPELDPFHCFFFSSLVLTEEQ